MWKFSSDHKLISTLLKVLYECKNEETATQIHKLVVTMINICKVEEQKQILVNLEKANVIKNENFKQRINLIKQEIHI